jgi:hypothetical protein
LAGDFASIVIYMAHITLSTTADLSNKKWWGSASENESRISSSDALDAFGGGNGIS